MDKLLSLSRLHVDEAVSTDLLKPRYSSKIAFSMDNSLAETMVDTDVSSTSSPPIDQHDQQQSPARGAASKAAKIAPPPTVNDVPRGGTLPVVKYVMDLAHQLANMECIGSCTAAQLKCEHNDEDLMAHGSRTRAATADLSASHFSQSYRSTDEDTDEYYGDFDDSFYSTFDETIDEDTCTTGPRQLRDQADIARVSRFDDATTLSSQNSRWL
jgi:hypothetical protein